jgi:hypothetical protein
MALITKLNQISLERTTPHDEVECTYSIVFDDKGNKFLQIDTYGSRGRQFIGKKSQSIRLSPEAIRQFKQIIDEL